MNTCTHYWVRLPNDSERPYEKTTFQYFKCKSCGMVHWFPRHPDYITHEHNRRDVNAAKEFLEKVKAANLEFAKNVE